MYRTATIATYDVLDSIFINAVVMEYPSTPGTEPPTRTVYSASISSVGEEDESVWLWTALQALQSRLSSGA